MHSLLRLSLSMCLFLAGTSLYAKPLTTEGTVTELNVAERMVTISLKRGQRKSVTLKIADDAHVEVGTGNSNLEDLKVGDLVTVTYDNVLDLITGLVRENSDLKELGNRLRKKFAATKTVVDTETGVLTLVYDFSKASQIRDFEGKSGAADIRNRALRIHAVETLTHVVDFQEGGLQAIFKYGNRAGNQPFLAVTGAAQLRLHHIVGGTADNIIVHLLSDGKLRAERDVAQENPLSIRWSVTTQKVVAVINNKQLGADRGNEIESGRFVLHGGSGGLSVIAPLTITGRPKEEWLRSFLAK